MTRHHPDFPPSGAERWTRCPYSVVASRGAEDRETEAAARGTAAHLLLNWALSEERAPAERVGQVIYRTEIVPGVPLEISVTPEMAEHVQSAVDYVLDLVPVREYLWLEHEVDLSRWMPHGHGTTDVLLYEAPSKTLQVIDAKFGRGYRVLAAGADGLGNRQLALYALGALDELETLLDIEHVQLVILQPPLDHYDTYLLPARTVVEFGEQIRETVMIALGDAPPAHPGELQCRWCAHKAACGPLADYLRETLMHEFDAETEPELATLDISGDDIARRMEVLELLDLWGRALRQEATARLGAGRAVPGWKLVEGRTQRRWADPDKAMGVLSRMLGKKQVTETRLLGIPAIEKLVANPARWQKLEASLVTRPPGKPTLVRESDKRAPWQGKVSAEEFDDHGNE